MSSWWAEASPVSAPPSRPAAPAPEVTLVVKGKAGRSGSSAMTSAGYSSAISPADSPERHGADTITGGRHINDPELVRIFTEEAPRRLRDLQDLGAPLLRDPNGELVINPSGDHSIPRTVVAINHTGLDFTLPLTRAITDAGVRIMETTTIMDIAVEQGVVTGVFALDYDAGEMIQLAAPCVILATGGAGRLFGITSNPNDATGDGYALALRAGAELRDMEFVQFYPWRCIIPFDRNRMPIQPSTFVYGATLRNKHGERFMLDYDPERRGHHPGHRGPRHLRPDPRRRGHPGRRAARCQPALRRRLGAQQPRPGNTSPSASSISARCR